MSTIEFQRTQDDLVAFTLLLRERAGLARGQRWMGAVAALVIFGGAALWHYRATGMPLLVAVYAAGGVAYALLWPRLNRACVRYCVKRNVGKLFPGPPSTHRLTLTEAGVEERSSEGDTLVAWNGIREVVQTERHLYVFTGPASAHVVPLAAFASPAEAAAFVSELRRRRRSL